jgi:uncharacterized protein with von Willebrand factor type A (vWA) domain
MNNEYFDKFINYGLIGDKNSRENIVNYIYNFLVNNEESNITISNSDLENFVPIINEIISNSSVKEICAEEGEVAFEITKEILEFINKSKKKINKCISPYDEEKELNKSFEKIKELDFNGHWQNFSTFLKNKYNKSELDIDFFEKEFKKSLDKRIEDKNKFSFENLKEFFLEHWDELLIKKQTLWELELIDQERKKFCKDLYSRIEELKKLQEVLEPFTNELGRLWDMTKGSWQAVNLDILKRYAELLKNDKSLKELANMLGKMQEAEKEFEEELFKNIQMKPEWKVNHASKSDLIGVYESDDISSLLPSETALLADETLQTVFFKKFAEKKLQTFEYQARILGYKEGELQDSRKKEKEVEKGPFIICVDTSGSMHGSPETVAKTLCFAILKIAIRDNRKCYLISFSTGIETLNLTDLKNSLDKIISFLSMSFHGGTDASPAMKEALKMLSNQDYKKADIVLVSDFVMPPFDKETHDHIQLAKENKTKFHSLVIGNSQNSATIKDFDNNWIYDLKNPKSVLTLVENMYKL